MSLDSAIHLLTATLYAALAGLLWWQALPTRIGRHTRLQAAGAWLLGMTMACFVSGKLDLALAGTEVRWSSIAGDVCLMGVAMIELYRARVLGSFRWNRCPEERRRCP